MEFKKGENMLEELKEILSEFCNVEEIDITESTSLSGDIGLASIDYFTIINAIEDHFDVKISDKELMEFRTVGDIIKSIESKRK